MAILASLGSIEFEIASNDFYQFKNNRRYNYAEFPKLEGKPTLQVVGGILDQIDFRIRLHSFNSPPEEELDRLVVAASEQAALPFLFGNTYQGNFVITNLSEDVRKAVVNTNGTTELQWIDVNVSLLEWVGDVEARDSGGAGGETGPSGDPNREQFSGFPYSSPFA